MMKDLVKMMTGKAASCKKVDDFLLDYLEGNMDDKTRKKFDEHIAMCKGCQKYLDEYKETVQLLRLIDKPEAPQELSDLTLEFLRSQDF